MLILMMMMIKKCPCLIMGIQNIKVIRAKEIKDYLIGSQKSKAFQAPHILNLIN